MDKDSKRIEIEPNKYLVLDTELLEITFRHFWHYEDKDGNRTDTAHHGILAPLSVEVKDLPEDLFSSLLIVVTTALKKKIQAAHSGEGD